MKIKARVMSIPGGLMIVPLFIGCLVGNLGPGAPKFFGSFTSALFTGALAMMGVSYVCIGATISFKATPYILKKGGVLLITKALCGVLAAVVVGHWLGEKPIETGIFAGLSTL